jgi:pimeloyl-ACP methyl ester carboxylesterase
VALATKGELMAADDPDLLRAEAQAFGEFAALHRDPVFFGVGVPRGDGRTVLVIPGLFGNDAYLQPLQIWLRRIGYSPAWSTLFPNAGCPERLSGQLRRALGAQRRDTSRPLAVIGHSRGGMLAWALASHLQHEVSHLVLLGSPAGAAVESIRAGGSFTPPPGIAHSSVVEAGKQALRLLDPDCDVPACGCPYVEDLKRPLSADTRVLSIYSRDDAVVAAAASRVTGAENVEVSGTHAGLVANRAVYRDVGRFLAS